MACKVNCRVVVCAAESVTLAVKVDVPAWVAVPEITPVDALSASPCGSEPELKDQR